jgi:hypothetical protein
MTLLMSCATATIIVVNKCVGLGYPPPEVTNALAEIRNVSPEVNNWIVDLTKALRAWHTPSLGICKEFINIRSLIP